jgi:hypothetical protein
MNRVFLLKSKGVDPAGSDNATRASESMWLLRSHCIRPGETEIEVSARQRDDMVRDTALK